MVMLTIFTPTYNRLYTLPRLRDSLLAQTDRDFEWLVVDDGSTDGSAAALALWQPEPRLRLTVVTVANGGKHRAINRAVKLAQGELFMIVDSDDWLAANAVDEVRARYEPVRSRPEFVGIAFARCDADGRIIGRVPRAPWVDGTALDRDRLRVLGDKAEVFRTDVLRQFPFPELDDERFLPEAVVWNRMARAGWLLRWYSEPVYFCEYLPDGLSARGSGAAASGPRGVALYVRESLQSGLPFWRKWMIAGAFVKSQRAAGRPYRDIAQAAHLGLIPTLAVGFVFRAGSGLRRIWRASR
jgi:glycosyltransferase involved in cell wall biosynthesis